LRWRSPEIELPERRVRSVGLRTQPYETGTTLATATTIAPPPNTRSA
jgi:hypothetical protein